MRRIFDMMLISVVFIAFTWFLQQSPPSRPVIAAIMLLAVAIATWVPSRGEAASGRKIPGAVLFAAMILGFVAASGALRSAGGSVTGGLASSLAGVALLAFAVIMSRMVGWPRRSVE